MDSTSPDSLTDKHKQALGQVPLYTSSFVGRSHELAQLKRMLDLDGARLITIIGPGGSGKTRITAQATTEVADRFEDGICWISLEGLSDSSQVVQAVVIALGLVEGTADPLDLLSGVLSFRQTLLVLDNCEHVLNACAQLAEHLLSHAPDCRILATSRERLNIPGEFIWPLPGLSFPSPPIGRKEADPSPGDLMTYDSIKLFVERAKAVDPTFQLSRTGGDLVSQICRQVDGLPLAVELAAARVRILGIEQIAERLGQRLDFLRGSSRTGAKRHLTLRATFDWSHDQLSLLEKVLFRRLGVFQGRFSLSAAESVTSWLPEGSLGQVPHLPREMILDLITGLVEKSLVVVERPPGERTMFRMLDMVKQYAEEKLLDAGESEAMRESHLAYYAGLVESATPGLKGPDQQLWVKRLGLSQDNLRAALGWAINRFNASGMDRYRQTAQKMANGMFWYWNASDMFSEGRDWFERILTSSEPRPPEPAVAEGLRMAGTLAWLMGDMSTAWLRQHESLDLCIALGDDLGAAHATMMLGRVLLYQGQPSQAVKYLSESASQLDKLGAFFERGLALGALSAALAMVGDHERAYAVAADCRDIFQKIGDPFFLGMALGDLGWAAYHKKSLTVATRHLQEALALRRLIDSDWQVAQALIYLAEINRFQGNVREAITYLEEARALAEDVGALSWLAHSNRQLGLIAAAERRWAEAAIYLLDSLSAANQLDDRAGAGMALEGLAIVAAAGHESKLAGLLYAVAERARSEAGPPRTPAEQEDWARHAEYLSPLFDDEFFREGQAWGQAISTTEAKHQAEPLAWLFDSQPTMEGKAIAHTLKIFALGQVDVIVGEKRLVAADWGYAKPKELFFYLVANPPRSKEQIGLDFWPDASSDQLRRNFRATLYHLRQALGDREWILFRDGHYSFNRARDYWYDVEAFERETAEALALAANEPERAIDGLSAAVNLYRGDFLTGLALDEWATSRRESLRRLHIRARLELAALLAAARRHQESADIYLNILSHDDLLESAHRGLMRSYAAMGRREQALRHFEELVRLLERELGVAPEPATVAVIDEIKAGR